MRRATVGLLWPTSAPDSDFSDRGLSSEQDGTMRITFDKPQKAVAPGQIAVIYVGDWCLGCGIITQTE